jgi:protoporphyrinogen oxidase
LALVEHTNYVDKSAFGGEHLLYLGDYVASDHAYFQMSEDALRDLFVAQLARFNPCFYA